VKEYSSGFIFGDGDRSIVGKGTSVEIRDDRFEGVIYFLGKLKMGCYGGAGVSFFSKLSFLSDKFWFSDRPIAGYTIGT
jgi:hypothetical protein